VIKFTNVRDDFGHNVVLLKSDLDVHQIHFCSIEAKEIVVYRERERERDRQTDRQTDREPSVTLVQNGFIRFP